MFVIIGWGLAMACIFGVYIVHGGNIGVILAALPFELTTIFGAAFAAFLVNNQMKVVKASVAGVVQCFRGSKYSKARYMELLALLYDILQKARKAGLMSIEKDVEDPHSSPLFQKYPNGGKDHHVTEFVTDYLRMMVSGNLNTHEIEGSPPPGRRASPSDQDCPNPCRPRGHRHRHHSVRRDCCEHYQRLRPRTDGL